MLWIRDVLGQSCVVETESAIVGPENTFDDEDGSQAGLVVQLPQSLQTEKDARAERCLFNRNTVNEGRLALMLAPYAVNLRDAGTPCGS
jgi:hypothetical protein